MDQAPQAVDLLLTGRFLKRHAATLWACAFLSVKSATLTGFVDLYILAFIHLGTRRVIVSGPSANPDAKWVTQQARNASATMADRGLPASHLLLGHDTKFTDSFDAVFEADGTEVKRVGPATPNLNAYIERFVQTVKAECLDHFLVCGENHLRYILREFVAHYDSVPYAPSKQWPRFRGVQLSGFASAGAPRRCRAR